MKEGISEGVLIIGILKKWIDVYFWFGQEFDLEGINYSLLKFLKEPLRFGLHSNV